MIECSIFPNIQGKVTSKPPDMAATYVLMINGAICAVHTVIMMTQRCSIPRMTAMEAFAAAGSV